MKPPPVRETFNCRCIVETPRHLHDRTAVEDLRAELACTNPLTPIAGFGEYRLLSADEVAERARGYVSKTMPVIGTIPVYAKSDIDARELPPRNEAETRRVLSAWQTQLRGCELHVSLSMLGALFIRGKITPSDMNKIETVWRCYPRLRCTSIQITETI